MRITRFTSTTGQRRASLPASAGFTLSELITVVAVIAVLVSVLCAALNSTKSKAMRINCLDNLRQLQTAWQMYAEENSDYIALNQTASAPNKRGVIANRLSASSWVTGNPVVDLTSENIQRGTLFPYVRSLSVYRCPMDDSTVYNHPDIPRDRSYSMDAYLGGDSDLHPSPKMRLTELNRTENTFVFIEEDESSVWQSSFLVMPKTIPSAIGSATAWISTPSDRHGRGCNLSFADGHIEYWRWYAPRVNTGSSSRMSAASTGLENPDLRRLQACIPQ